MATTCETYLSDIGSAYDESHWILNTYLTPLKVWFEDNYVTHPFDATWRGKVKSLAVDVENILAILIHGNWQLYHPPRLPYYLENCISADIDMDMIINTMLTADPTQVLYFVGLVDAYRQSVWNQPFNQEFFAALAKGFAQWE